MTLTCTVLEWLAANKVSVTAGTTIVFTAFLFNSPEPKPEQWLYRWIRASLFSIFNRNNHPIEAARPDPKAQA